MIMILRIRFLIMVVLSLIPLVLTSHDNISIGSYPSSNTESVHEIDHLIRLCFTNTNRLITLIGNVSQKLAQEVHKSELTATTRMSNVVPQVDVLYTMAKHSRVMYIDELYFRFDHKAQGFVLAASSQPVLRRQLKELMDSRWWEAGGLFIITDDGTAINNSCNNAHSFMRLTWHYNILSSVFLCHDEGGRLMMYSYNPYNDMAPKNWLTDGKYLSRRGRPWILLKRSASDIPEDCSEVFFDKTKTLGGYKIRTNAVPLPPRLWIDYNKTGLERYHGVEGKMIRCIFRFLNASAEDVPYRGIDPIGYSDKDGTYFGMLSDVVTGRVDIGLNGRYVVDSWKLGMSYPHASSAFCFLIKSRGNVPQWMNLASGFDVWMSLGLTGVILLTTAILSYQTSFSTGSLNGLRLLIAAALLKLPSQTSTRLYLASVFLLCLIANGAFQGQLMSLLTKPRAYHNPETHAELGKAGHKIIGYPPFAKYIEDPVLLSHYSSDPNTNYSEHALHTEHIGFTVDCQVIHTYFRNVSDLHVVSQKLQAFYMNFITASDWPLLDRFNQLVQRLVEAGFFDHWRTQDTEATIAFYQRTGSSKGFRSPYLTFADLAFVFDWLTFGLIISTLVFLYEVLSTRYSRTKFRRNRRAH